MLVFEFIFFDSLLYLINSALTEIACCIGISTYKARLVTVWFRKTFLLTPKPFGQLLLIYFCVFVFVILFLVCLFCFAVTLMLEYSASRN